jgi:hypothetical protein
MLMRLFLGIIIILCFLMVYPFISELFTNPTDGFLHMMANITKPDGSPAMSDFETSLWGLFPIIFLLLGCGGVAWLIVRDKER